MTTNDDQLSRATPARRMCAEPRNHDDAGRRSAVNPKALGQEIGRHSVEVSWVLAELDMDALRRQYSDLFDRAAQSVYRAGRDLDDVEVCRFLMWDFGEAGTSETPLSSLASGSDLLDDTRRQLGDTGEAMLQQRGTRIIGLSVRAYLRRECAESADNGGIISAEFLKKSLYNDAPRPV